MNRIDVLRKNYQRIVETSWDQNVSGAQRVWLAVYDKEDERKLRLRLPLFEESTVFCGHKWQALDLTNAFADWMCSPDNISYSGSYFDSPDNLDNAALGGFMDSLVKRIESVLAAMSDPDNTVLAYTVWGLSLDFLRFQRSFRRWKVELVAVCWSSFQGFTRITIIGSWMPEMDGTI